MQYLNYSKYKNCSIGWPEKIPSHWFVYKLKRKILSSNSGEIINRKYWGGYKEILYTCRESPIFSDYLEFPEDKRTQPGDLLISRNGIPYIHRPPKGSIYTNVVQRLKLLEPKEAEFLAFALQAFSKNIRLEGVSIDSLSYQNWKELLLPIPPLQEQLKITRFLKYQINKTNKLIDNQIKMIDLLREKRELIMQQLITKGVRYNTEMKESGFSWYGDIPTHWKVLKAKYCTDVFVPQRNKPVLNSESKGYPWITMECISSGKINANNSYVSMKEVESSNIRVLKKGSVVVSCVGRLAIASIVKFEAVINQQFQAYIPSKSIDPSYLAHLITISSDYFNSISTTSTIPYVNRLGFENFPVLIPPREEQEIILSELNLRLSIIEKREFIFNRSISLLKERLKSLIFSVVTGQIDISNSSLV